MKFSQAHLALLKLDVTGALARADIAYGEQRDSTVPFRAVFPDGSVIEARVEMGT
jgi:hypothetical protein